MTFRSSETVPADVFVEVFASLRAAAEELDALTATEVPVPDALERALREREALWTVLRRIIRAAPPDRKRRVGAMLREERAAHERRYVEAHIGCYPVLPEVLRDVEAALEGVKQSARVDRALSDLIASVR